MIIKIVNAILIVIIGLSTGFVIALIINYEPKEEYSQLEYSNSDVYDYTIDFPPMNIEFDEEGIDKVIINKKDGTTIIMSFSRIIEEIEEHYFKTEKR